MKQLDKYFTLQRAVMYDHSAEIVELLLKIGVNANQKDGYFRITLLHCACVNGNFNVKILLENKADIDAIKSYNQTSLHIATQYEYPEIVKLLLENGCKTKIKTDQEMT